MGDLQWRCHLAKTPTIAGIITMAKKAELTHDNNTITRTKYMGKIKNDLRLLWSRSALKRHALRRAKVTKGIYHCANCLQSVRGEVLATYAKGTKKAGKCYMKKNVHVDHIQPCGPFIEHEDIGPYVNNLLNCTIDDLQVLCISCHSHKTAEERASAKNLKP